LMLCNDVSLRNLIPGELGKGFSSFCCRAQQQAQAYAVSRQAP
jgi:2-keto-4-pentenoate hydratase/2-oxohepta-3-ene-1,7-dioic acid hydratase in catechol pathway